MIDLADDHYALDIGRAEKSLGWRPRRSLRETLPRMVAGLKADPGRGLGSFRLFHTDFAGRSNALACGLLIAVISARRGRPEIFGGGWPSLRKSTG